MREDMGPSMADEADRWRSNKPLVDVRGPGGQDRQRGGMMSEQSSPGLADTESTVSIPACAGLVRSSWFGDICANAFSGPEAAS